MKHYLFVFDPVNFLNSYTNINLSSINSYIKSNYINTKYKTNFINYEYIDYYNLINVDNIELDQKLIETIYKVNKIINSRYDSLNEYTKPLMPLYDHGLYLTLFEEMLLSNPLLVLVHNSLSNDKVTREIINVLRNFIFNKNNEEFFNMFFINFDTDCSKNKGFEYYAKLMGSSIVFKNKLLHKNVGLSYDTEINNLAKSLMQVFKDATKSFLYTFNNVHNTNVIIYSSVKNVIY